MLLAANHFVSQVTTSRGNQQAKNVTAKFQTREDSKKEVVYLAEPIAQVRHDQMTDKKYQFDKGQLILFQFSAVEGERCTQNADCQSTLLCDGNRKTCRQDAKQLTEPNGEFCTENLCQEWEGDCDHDSECAGSLKCGTNNCPAQFNWNPTEDCCYKPGSDNAMM